MVDEGHRELEPLYKFRNWLASIRSDPNYRCSYRRNGAAGLGPFTLSARKEILQKLRRAQQKAPWVLINSEEIREIHRLWRLDRTSSSYRE